jgi:hypothetical protein
LGFVIYAHANNGKIYTKVDNGYELDELHNVNVSTAASGDYLRYNGTLWVDSTIQAGDLPTGIDAAKIGTGVVSNTEFGYLDGVTSAIQTQLNGKQATLTNPVTGMGVSGQVTYFSGTSAVTGSNNLFWDATNNRLGIGTTSPGVNLDVVGTGSAIVRIKGGSAANQGAAYYIREASTNNTFFAIGDSAAVIGGAVDTLSVIYTRVAPLSLYLNGADRHRFHANSNVTFGGIVDAGYRLDVQGTLRNTTDAYFATSSGDVRIGTTTGTVSTGFTFLTINGSSYGALELRNGGALRATMYHDGSNLNFSASTGGMAIGTAGAERVRITTTGNVGLGTTSPTNKLMVIAGNSSGFNLSYDTSGNNRTGIFAWTNASSGGGIGGGMEQTSDFVFTARSTSASYLSFGAGNIGFAGNTGLTAGSTFTPTTRLLIWGGTGNVSIGNTNNTYNLDVSGTLRNTTDAYFATSSGNVGIGNTSTSYKLDVTGTIRSTSTLLWGTSGGTYEYAGGATHIRGYSNSTLNLDYSGGSSGWGINNQADTSRLLSVNDIGCLGLGIATFEASVTRAVYIATGVSPAASATDGFVMYSADITAGNAAAHFRTEGGAIIKLYQQTTGVAGAALTGGGGTALTDTDTFDGYTLKQIVKALRNNGLLA